jgi:hypothetical protein
LVEIRLRNIPIAGAFDEAATVEGNAAPQGLYPLVHHR